MIFQFFFKNLRNNPKIFPFLHPCSIHTLMPCFASFICIYIHIPTTHYCWKWWRGRLLLLDDSVLFLSSSTLFMISYSWCCCFVCVRAIFIPLNRMFISYAVCLWGKNVNFCTTLQNMFLKFLTLTVLFQFEMTVYISPCCLFVVFSPQGTANKNLISAFDSGCVFIFCWHWKLFKLKRC